MSCRVSKPTVSPGEDEPITIYDLSFVDSVAASPTVRLALEDDPVWSVHESTDFGMPAIDRAIVSTLLADGGQVPASAYGLRQLNLVCSITAPTEDATAAQLQKLFRELDRPTNILRWQPDVTNPVFFRTFRSDVAQVHWDPMLKRVAATVLAEPFAVGVEETLPSIVLGGDPASGGIYADVTGIKGDVETPLILVLPASGSTIAVRQAAFGTRRQTDAIIGTCVEEAELLVLGADATTQTVAGYSGGTPNCVRVSFATVTTMSRRVYQSFPTGALATGAKEVRGMYRVFARVKKSVAGDPVTVQLGWGAFDPAGIANASVLLPATTNVVMVDLGLISAPFGPDPIVNGYSGVELASTGVFFELRASRTSGTTNLEIDFIAFIPASDQFTIVKFAEYGGVGGAATHRPVWDGPNQLVYKSVSGLGSAVRLADPSPFVGAPALDVSPGMTNRIWGLRDVTPGVATDLTGVTYSARYYPRYLFVRPVST